MQHSVLGQEGLLTKSHLRQDPKDEELSRHKRRKEEGGVYVEGIVCDSSKGAVAERSPGRLNKECERSVRGKFGEVL